AAPAPPACPPSSPKCHAALPDLRPPAARTPHAVTAATTAWLRVTPPPWPTASPGPRVCPARSHRSGSSAAPWTDRPPPTGSGRPGGSATAAALTPPPTDRDAAHWLPRQPT